MDDTPIVDAFRGMPVPLMIVGPDGAILRCNRAAGRLFGYRVDGLMGLRIFDVLSVASMADLNAHIKAPANDAIVRGMTGRDHSGRAIPLSVQLTAWNDAKRGLLHALILRDISNDLETARQTYDERQRTINAIEGARIGIFEFDLVADTLIVSDIWLELLELEDSNKRDVLKEWRARVHPDDLEVALDPIQTCREDIRQRANCEYRLRSRDGSRWRWMRMDIAIARRDEAGQVTRLSGALVDITERKEIEDALRRSEEQFRSAFENATIGKAIVGLDGRFLRVNPALCDLLGYSEKELLETDFQTLTHADDLSDDLFKLDLLKADKIPAYQIEKRFIRANGSVMWGLLSVGMVKNAEGQPDHFISQIVDITEQRRMGELKSEFVAKVSHELRTPLTSVLGSLALLSSMDTEPFSDEAQRLLYIAQVNGRRLQELVNDILDFEKFSAHQMRFSLARHHIAGLIEEAVLANMTFAVRYGVRFNIECPDRAVTAFVDPKRFQQVMTNLLTNAAKFAEKDSMIDIAVEVQDKAVRVSVTNEGDGIPDAFRDQIFAPFSQAMAPATRARGGTGLGLNITKQIVEQTGGKIGFESDRGGRTTFWFTAPRKEPG